MPARSLSFDEIMCKHVPSEGGLGCWEWQGHIDKFGYGKLTWKYTGYLAHRLVYMELVGPIPEGLELDHLCKNRRCVNPDHLEPVTHTENVSRAQVIKTECDYGHPYKGDNQPEYSSSGKKASCKTCMALARSTPEYKEANRMRCAEWYAKNKGQNTPLQKAALARKARERRALLKEQQAA